MAAPIELLGSLDCLGAATIVMQRARLAPATAGVWEAADVQWWWRPRATDELPLRVWFDDTGPCAAVALIDWSTTRQAGALSVSHAIGVDEVWAGLVDAIERLEPTRVDVSVREDDLDLTLLDGSGFKDDETQPAPELSGVLWMDAECRPPLAPSPDSFVVADRRGRPDRPHPMRAQNGDAVEARLPQCSLYDPELDLANTAAGSESVVGYAAFALCAGAPGPRP